jgi:hypothetical protein
MNRRHRVGPSVGNQDRNTIGRADSDNRSWLLTDQPIAVGKPVLTRPHGFKHNAGVDLPQRGDTVGIHGIPTTEAVRQPGELREIRSFEHFVN